MSTISYHLTPQFGARPHGIDMRVEDYLDDKLQSTADLENLDALLASVELQRSQLQTQLENATQQLDEARTTSRDRQASLEERIRGFQDLQHSIDARVKVAAASDAPNQAIARLQAPMGRLRTVELAREYFELVRHVERLRREATAYLPASPKAALEPYSRLKRLAVRLAGLSGEADDAAVHLVNYVETVTEKLWEEMKSVMSAEMEALLKARSWPAGVDPAAEMDEEWLGCFEKMLDLQVPEVVYSGSGSGENLTLLPFEVMCSIFVSEFRFHFLSDKPTSKPEAVGTHCFPWFLATVEKWEDFFRDNLGHLLAAKFKDTPVAGRSVYVDPVSAFITTMLPVLREKVHGVVAGAVETPTFLSSLMGQLMTFDENVRARFGYDGDGDDGHGWDGLTTEVLDGKWFEPWFAAEREFALERFQAIVASPDARNIDYDYAADGKTKPTYGAVRVTDLLRSITSQYERLRKFRHKIRFLTGVQLDILDGYHDRLRGSLEAYQAITSTVGRTLHGVTRDQIAALEGTGALETLCKVYGSADHVVATLRDWSSDDFFVTLWDELQARATPAEEGAEEEEEQANKKFAGDMSYEEVRDRTSNAIGSESQDGILFDETITAYGMRRKAAQDFLVGALAKSHYDAFRAYATRVQWTTISEGGAEIGPFQLAITPELDEPLRILRRNLDFLSKALSTAASRRVWRNALEKLQDMLWSEVLMRHTFTALGAAQFLRDFGAISSLVERYIPNGALTSLASLDEALRLLSLPVEGAAGSGSAGGDNKNNNSGSTTAAAAGPAISLREANDRVFTDNTEAKAVLEELGVETLTPANARHILQRRVENSE